MGFCPAEISPPGSTVLAVTKPGAGKLVCIDHRNQRFRSIRPQVPELRWNSTLHGVVFAIFCGGPAVRAELAQASSTSREHHNGNSGSRRALRLAVVAEAE